MGKIVMPKNSALLDEVEAVLKIYYEAGGWLSNDDYKVKLKNIIGDDQYASSYTKKSQITSYFGFAEWEDIENVRSLRRITERGKIFYQHLISSNREEIIEDLVKSLENVTFGRNNFGCPDSDSDVEPPVVFVRSVLELGYLTYKEYAYLLWKLEDCGENYTDCLREIKQLRLNGHFELDQEAQKYTDAKPIMVLIRSGLLAEGETIAGNKQIIIPKENLEKYAKRIKNLKIYNIDKDVIDEIETDELLASNKSTVVLNYDFKESPTTDGQNLIVYGTPGCGKSYYVEHTLLDGYPKDNYIRTTFYQDYTNTDFVGQILPVVEGDKVTYKFNPGPFTLALEQAIRKPNERIALVIEELNRGSAASIFGDIFQLLDRKEGVSEYGITNVNIINYLKEKFEGVYTFKEIRLPGNLSIYATMNTSDQNVFTLDTAFKRRWKFKKLINEFAVDHQFKNKYIPGADITWEELVNDINEYILECSSGLNSEDKQLGVYFVDENGMRKEKVDASDPEAVNAFAYKVLEYLWSDVAKFDRSKWFVDGIKSLDELVKEYKNKGLEVFVDGIFDK